MKNRIKKPGYVKLALLLMLSFLIAFIGNAGIAAKATTEDYGQGLVGQWTYSDGTNYPITDEAGLLTDDELLFLEDKIRNLQEQYQMGIVILTVNDLGNRTAEQYADDFYDYYGFGYGETHDGIILILGMGDRSWQIETTGSAIRIFTDSRLESIGEDVVYYLSDGNYYNAFDTFVSRVGGYLEDNYNDTHFTTGNVLICLAIGFVLAVIVLLCFIGQLHNVKFREGADDYRTQPLNLTIKKDNFMGKSVTRTKIEKSSGGSSTHTGSSGTSHGGTGGHF